MSVSDDAFLGGALQILQPARGYRAGVDAVFLAAAVPEQPGRAERVLDAGAGVGTAGLCVARRCSDKAVVLIEREPLLVDLAHENIRRNGLEDRVSVLKGDIGGVTDLLLTQAGAPPASFDHVIANPPFHVEGAGTASDSRLRAAAHAMGEGGLAVWCRFLARMTRPGGTASLIHKADALPAVLHGFAGRFGGIKVLPVHPRQGEPAIRVIVQGTKGSKAPLSLLAGAVLHEDGNGFTPGAVKVLRLGSGLGLDYWKGLA